MKNKNILFIIWILFIPTIFLFSCWNTKTNTKNTQDFSMNVERNTKEQTSWGYILREYVYNAIQKTDNTTALNKSVCNMYTKFDICNKTVNNDQIQKQIYTTLLAGSLYSQKDDFEYFAESLSYYLYIPKDFRNQYWDVLDDFFSKDLIQLENIWNQSNNMSVVYDSLKEIEHKHKYVFKNKSPKYILSLYRTKKDTLEFIDKVLSSAYSGSKNIDGLSNEEFDEYLTMVFSSYFDYENSSVSHDLVPIKNNFNTYQELNQHEIARTHVKAIDKSTLNFDNVIKGYSVIVNSKYDYDITVDQATIYATKNNILQFYNFTNYILNDNFKRFDNMFDFAYLFSDRKNNYLYDKGNGIDGLSPYGNNWTGVMLNPTGSIGTYISGSNLYNNYYDSVDTYMNTLFHEMSHVFDYSLSLSKQTSSEINDININDVYQNFNLNKYWGDKFGFENNDYTLGKSKLKVNDISKIELPTFFIKNDFMNLEEELSKQVEQYKTELSKVYMLDYNQWNRFNDFIRFKYKGNSLNLFTSINNIKDDIKKFGEAKITIESLGYGVNTGQKEITIKFVNKNDKNWNINIKDDETWDSADELYKLINKEIDYKLGAKHNKVNVLLQDFNLKKFTNKYVENNYDDYNFDNQLLVVNDDTWTIVNVKLHNTQNIHKNGNSFGKYTIIGIIVFSAVFVTIVIVTISLIVRNKKRQKNKQEDIN